MAEVRNPLLVTLLHTLSLSVTLSLLTLSHTLSHCLTLTLSPSHTVIISHTLSLLLTHSRALSLSPFLVTDKTEASRKWLPEVHNHNPETLYRSTSFIRNCHPS